MVTRIYAPFIDKEHQTALLEEVLQTIPERERHRLYLFLGMLDSTIAEGYRGHAKKETE